MASVIQSLTIYQSRQDGFSELLKIRKRGFICQKTFVLKSGTQKYSEKVLFYKVHENGFFAIFKFVSNFVSEIFRKQLAPRICVILCRIDDFLTLLKEIFLI